VLFGVLSLRLFGWRFLSLGAGVPTNPAGLRRALSPTFRAGAMVFFIPWRVVAEESGAAH
jgi:hypothetical protein